MEPRLKLLASLSALAYLGGLAALFWRPLRWLLNPVIAWIFGRDIRLRLLGLNRGAEEMALLRPGV